MSEAKSEENETSTTHTISTSSSVSDFGPGGSPGDGVCPSVSSLQAVFRSAYNSWATPESHTVPDGPDELFDMNAFLQLMTKFPSFRLRPLEDIIVPGVTTSDLIVDLFMSLETCMLPECMQHEKRVPYHLLIGRSAWNTYEVVCSREHENASQLGLSLHSLRSLTRLALTWSYILCCRWVEILQGAGENAEIIRPEIGTANDFWEVIHREQWQAIVSYNGKVYYAPFMLRSSLDLGAEMLVIPSPNCFEPFL
jgi:hypothetical protein